VCLSHQDSFWVLCFVWGYMVCKCSDALRQQIILIALLSWYR